MKNERITTSLTVSIMMATRKIAAIQPQIAEVTRRQGCTLAPLGPGRRPGGAARTRKYQFQKFFDVFECFSASAFISS